MLMDFFKKIEQLRLKKTPVALLANDEEDQKWQRQRREYLRSAEKHQREQDGREKKHLQPGQKPRHLLRRYELVMLSVIAGLFVLGFAGSARVVGLGGNAVALAPIADRTCDNLLHVLQRNGFNAQLDGSGAVTVYGHPDQGYLDGDTSVHSTITLDQFVKWLPTTATSQDLYDPNEDVLFYDPIKEQICYVNRDTTPGAISVWQEIDRQLDMHIAPDILSEPGMDGSVYCKQWGTRLGFAQEPDYWDDLRDFFDHIDKGLAIGNGPVGLHPLYTYLGKPDDHPPFTSASPDIAYDIDKDMLQQAQGVDGMDYRVDGSITRTICVPGNWQTGAKKGGSKFSQQAVLQWLTKVYNLKQDKVAQGDDASNKLATSVLDAMVKWIGNSITWIWSIILGWGANLLFPYVTPANMTYGLEVVDLGHQLVLAIVGSLASLALVIGAYRLLGRRYLGESGTELLDTLGQVCIGLVAATFCWPLLSMLIDKESELTRSVTLFLYQNTYGKISDQDWMNKIFTMGGAIADYTAGGGQGFGMLLVLVVEVIMAILLMLQDLTRIVLLDLLLIFSPLWIFCLFFKPWRKIGSVGLGFFGVTLLMQVVQVISLDLGQILLLKLPSLGSSPSDSLPPLILLMLSGMFYYITFRIPGMLYQLFAGSFGGFMVTNKGLLQGTRSAIKETRGTIDGLILKPANKMLFTPAAKLLGLGQTGQAGPGPAATPPPVPGPGPETPPRPGGTPPPGGTPRDLNAAGLVLYPDPPDSGTPDSGTPAAVLPLPDPVLFAEMVAALQNPRGNRQNQGGGGPGTGANQEGSGKNPDQGGSGPGPKRTAPPMPDLPEKPKPNTGGKQPPPGPTRPKP